MKKKKKLRWIRAVLLFTVAVCLFQIGREYFLSVKHRRYQENLSNLLRAQENIEEMTKDSAVERIKQSATGTSAADKDSDMESADASIQSQVIMDKFKELYAANSDMVGWICIPDTVIDYPVMQCEDNEYYLHHDFYGGEDKYGCLFVKDIADVDTPGTNFIIYGHNMKDGAMFGELDEYVSESFYEEHSRLLFDTLYEERVYEIMTVFRSRVYQEDEAAFRYYQFYQADTEEEFQVFYDNVMDMALYDTGVTAEFGDTFLTLSTCAYHEEDGRLVIVAKRVLY